MTNRARSALVLTFPFLVLGGLEGCGGDGGQTATPPSTVAPGVDAGTPDEPNEPIADSGTPQPEAACDKTKPFGTPEEVTELNALPAGGARLTPDMLTVYFHAGAGAGARLYQAKRASTSEPFGTPERVPGLSSAAEEGNISEHATIPTVSPDQLTIYFQSNRNNPPTPASVNLWYATRASVSDDFGAPSLLAAANDTENTGQPFVTPDGSKLYYTPRRGGATNAAIKIYRASITGPGAVQDMEEVAELTSDEREESPVLTADELVIYFARSGDIWSARRADKSSAFTDLAEVAGLSVDGAQDFPTWVSNDECVLYFSSTRSGSNKIYRAFRPK